jgi:hypothetical protein
VINGELDFSTSTFDLFSAANPAQSEILFVGEPVDPRGKQAIAALGAISNRQVKLGYIAEKNGISVNDVPQNFDALVQLCTGGGTIRVETTTLGLAEILKIIQACKHAGVKAIEFVYVEPKEYKLRKPVAVGYFDPRDFELTKNRIFSAVRGFSYEHAPEVKEHFVFLLGFESSRLMQAVSQQDRELRSKYAVIGVPPFRVGWETNSLASHAHDLANLNFDSNTISFCAANSAREAYLTLWSLYKNLGAEHSILIVSPLGTKPHAVGAALFLVETKAHAFPTALYYDHPIRPQHRTDDLGAWHFWQAKWP